MAKLPDVETQRTVRCGTHAGEQVQIIQTDETVLIRIGDLPAFTIPAWMNLTAAVTTGMLTLAGMKR